MRTKRLEHTIWAHCLLIIMRYGFFGKKCKHHMGYWKARLMAIYLWPSWNFMSSWYCIFALATGALEWFGHLYLQNGKLTVTIFVFNRNHFVQDSGYMLMKKGAWTLLNWTILTMLHLPWYRVLEYRKELGCFLY